MHISINVLEATKLCILNRRTLRYMNCIAIKLFFKKWQYLLRPRNKAKLEERTRAKKKVHMCGGAWKGTNLYPPWQKVSRQMIPKRENSRSGNICMLFQMRRYVPKTISQRVLNNCSWNMGNGVEERTVSSQNKPY